MNGQPNGHVIEHAYKETLLKLSGVDVSYDNRPILRDVHLEIKNLTRPGMTQGQVVGLLGPSGMGKSTLFRILAGIEEPDSGSVLIGQDLKPVQRGTVGVVAQSYPLFAHRTVKGNLMVAGRASGGKDAADKTQKLLARFGLEEHANKYPAQLSGGQRQRVAIAQQFMCSEGLLLMDEPFSGLDLLAQERVLGFIAEMAASDELTTFVLVTHDISAALQACDTIWLLGRDRDANGEPIAGARIQKSYDLIARGLCYQPSITALPEYAQVRNEIRDDFRML